MTTSGAPISPGYCHCRSCQTWHGAPFSGRSAWPADQVEITEEIRVSSKDPVSGRVSCAGREANIANLKSEWGTVALYPAVIGEATFEPQFNLHYGERLIDLADGMPKFLNAPERIGGDGVLAYEPLMTRWSSAGA
jgi:hypothetical protein